MRAEPSSSRDEGASTTPDEDRGTETYFDEFVPEYSISRLEHVASFVREHARPYATLLDIGCGAGDALAYLKRESGVEAVVGLDVSAKSLERTAERVGCETVHGSILDPVLVERLADRYDFAVLAAILHHLIGRTRQRSLSLARDAVENALRVVRPGGHVLIHEPVYGPRAFSASLFWVKKGVTGITSDRVEFGGAWSNIGAPVVSYMTNDQLRGIAWRVDAELVGTWIEREHPPWFVRLVSRHYATTLALQRPV